MTQQANLPRIEVPRGWPPRVRSATLHVIALGQAAARADATSFSAGPSHLSGRAKIGGRGHSSAFIRLAAPAKWR